MKKIFVAAVCVILTLGFIVGGVYLYTVNQDKNRSVGGLAVLQNNQHVVIAVETTHEADDELLDEESEELQESDMNKLGVSSLSNEVRQAYIKILRENQNDIAIFPQLGKDGYDDVIEVPKVISIYNILGDETPELIFLSGSQRELNIYTFDGSSAIKVDIDVYNFSDVSAGPQFAIYLNNGKFYVYYGNGNAAGPTGRLYEYIFVNGSLEINTAVDYASSGGEGLPVVQNYFFNDEAITKQEFDMLINDSADKIEAVFVTHSMQEEPKILWDNAYSANYVGMTYDEAMTFLQVDGSDEVKQEQNESEEITLNTAVVSCLGKTLEQLTDEEIMPEGGLHSFQYFTLSNFPNIAFAAIDDSDPVVLPENSVVTRVVGPIDEILSGMDADYLYSAEQFVAKLDKNLSIVSYAIDANPDAVDGDNCLFINFSENEVYSQMKIYLDKNDCVISFFSMTLDARRMG